MLSKSNVVSTVLKALCDKIVISSIFEYSKKRPYIRGEAPLVVAPLLPLKRAGSPFLILYNMKQLSLILILATVCFTSAAQNKPRFALLLGNSDYAGSAYLKNPGNDVDSMEKKLILCGFTVLKEKNLKQLGHFNKMVDSFFHIINQRPCEAFFYYSGHGIQQDGDNFLIPTEARINSPSDVVNYCYKLKNVLDKMDDSKSSTNIIVLDACRNNPFSKGQRSAGEKGLQVVNQAPKESFIIYATSPNSVANDGSGNNSPLVTSFIRYINEPGLSISNLLLRIIDEVNRQYPGQRPWGSVSIRREFYFAPPVAASSTRSATASGMERTLADVVLVSSADCFVQLDKEPNDIFIRAGSHRSFSRYAGPRAIHAVDFRDTTLKWDTTFEAGLNEVNVIYVPIRELQEKRAARLAALPANRRRMAALESLQRGLVKINGGSFVMGNNSGKNDETPEHRVTLSSFLIGRFEVTQEEWTSLMGYNPSQFSNCPQCPVENVTWTDVIRFIDTLNLLTGENFRLPTEAEWEFAARGANNGGSPNGFSNSRTPDKTGWVFKNSGKKTHEVGSLIANEAGIWDMTGNVAEWCSDWYGAGYYRAAPSANPTGPENGSEKVLRGGSWNEDESNCRNSVRAKQSVDHKDSSIGFRIAKDL